MERMEVFDNGRLSIAHIGPVLAPVIGTQCLKDNVLGIRSAVR